ncbi:unnamed protein product, partial [Cyprideis torosa]
MAARVLSGVALEIHMVSGTIYIADIAEPKYRGRLTALIQIILNIGTIMVYTCGLFLDWKESALVLGVLPVLIMVAALNLPESPSFLLTKGRDDDALRSLGWYRGLPYDVQDPKQRCVFASFGMMYGVCVTYTAIAIPSWKEDPNRPFNMTDNDAGLHGSLVNIGSMAGGIIGGIVITWLGNKKLLILSQIPLILSWLVLAYPPSKLVMMAVRILSGVATEIHMVSGTMYIADVAEPKYRGRLTALIIIVLNIGTVMVFGFGLFLDWKESALVLGIFPVLIMVAALSLPESPSFLLTKGRDDDALRSLGWYRGLPYDVQEEKQLDSVFAEFGCIFSSFAMMYAVCVTYTAIAIPSWNEDPNRPFNMSDNDAGLHGSIVNIGSIAGGIVGGVIITWLGNKKQLILSQVPLTLTWLVLAYPPSKLVMMAVRVLSGVTTEIHMVSGTMYIADVAEPKYRGRLTALIQIVMNIGTITVYACGLFMDWKESALVFGVLPVLIMVAALNLPESPSFLLTKGRDDDALRSLGWYR